jgi:hypothetical protein
MNEIVETKFNELANDYRSKKQTTLLNLLQCGKILFDVKASLPHGTWLTFISDVRVSESERTAQRLISIFKNYRHLIDEETFRKTDALTQLGVSHLLELQKLPDRFKKEIQVIKEKNGEKIEEIVQVIDEERLSDFLEQRVQYEGKQTPVRDLPLNEMKKYIKEAQGIFEPESYDNENQITPADSDISNHRHNDTGDNNHDSVVESTEGGDVVSRASDGLVNFLSLGSEVLPLVQKIDLAAIAVANQKDVDELKVELKRTISHCEAMILACIHVKDRI